MKKIFNLFLNIFFFFICFLIIIAVIFYIQIVNSNSQINKSLKDTEIIYKSNEDNKEVIQDFKKEYSDTELTVVKSKIVKK